LSDDGVVRWLGYVRLINKLAIFVNRHNGTRLGRRGYRYDALATIPPVYTVLAVLQVIIAVVVIFLVLLHSGKDAGLSGAFGIGGGGGFSGGSMVERNLDRATIFFSVLFVLNTLVLLKI